MQNEANVPNAAELTLKNGSDGKCYYVRYAYFTTILECFSDLETGSQDLGCFCLDPKLSLFLSSGGLRHPVHNQKHFTGDLER